MRMHLTKPRDRFPLVEWSPSAASQVMRGRYADSVAWKLVDNYGVFGVACARRIMETAMSSRRLSLSVVLLACGCSSPSPRAGGRLIDPGFESNGIAASPVVGWYSDDVKDGRLRVANDSTFRVEGTRSLRVDVIHPRGPADGRASISQVIDIAPSQERRFEVSVALRGRAGDLVTLHIYVWDGNVARRLAAKDVTVQAEWASTTLQFEVPRNYDKFGVFVYVPNEPDASVWLDDVRLRVPMG